MTRHKIPSEWEYPPHTADLQLEPSQAAGEDKRFKACRYSNKHSINLWMKPESLQVLDGMTSTSCLAAWRAGEEDSWQDVPDTSSPELTNKCWWIPFDKVGQRWDSLLSCDVGKDFCVCLCSFYVGRFLTFILNLHIYRIVFFLIW